MRTRSIVVSLVAMLAASPSHAGGPYLSSFGVRLTDWLSIGGGAVVTYDTLDMNVSGRMKDLL